MGHPACSSLLQGTQPAPAAPCPTSASQGSWAGHPWCAGAMGVMLCELFLALQGDKASPGRLSLRAVPDHPELAGSHLALGMCPFSLWGFGSAAVSLWPVSSVGLCHQAPPVGNWEDPSACSELPACCGSCWPSRVPERAKRGGEELPEGQGGAPAAPLTHSPSPR